MASEFTVSHSWMAYIHNDPCAYPTDDSSTISQSHIDTGWHVFPNILFKHFMTPKDWVIFQSKYEAYHPKSISVEVFNMVPMTQQMAIQGSTVFTAFNNCIYGLCYEDLYYETSWYNWYEREGVLDYIPLNLIYKEGRCCLPGQNTFKRYTLPKYAWRPPNSRTRSARTYDNWNEGGNSWSAVYPGGQAYPNRPTQTGATYYERPSGVFWDPLNEPEKLLELRPGKNAIKMSWNCHPCDSHKWFNIDQLAWWHPYMPEGPYYSGHLRPGEFTLTSECDPDRLSTQYEASPAVNDYTIPNWCNVPVVPMQWWWKEIQESIIPQEYSKTNWPNLRANQTFVGTEEECFKYGPHQMFMKLIPLFDTQGSHISCSANVSIKTTLTLEVKDRRSALYAPTHGPMSWYDMYTAQTVHLRFPPAMIRYRTGGMRRTWQNMEDNQTTDTIAHAREPPYNLGHVNGAGTGIDNTRTTPSVSYSATSQTATIHLKRKAQPRMTPSAPPLEEDDSEMPLDHGSLYPPIDQLKVHKV